MKAYANGKPSRGFPGWPYKQVHQMENVVVTNVQKQLNAMQKGYMPQHQNPSSDSDSDFNHMSGEEESDNHEPCMRDADSGSSSD